MRPHVFFMLLRMYEVYISAKTEIGISGIVLLLDLTLVSWPCSLMPGRIVACNHQATKRFLDAPCRMVFVFLDNACIITIAYGIVT